MFAYGYAAILQHHQKPLSRVWNQNEDFLSWTDYTRIAWSFIVKYCLGTLKSVHTTMYRYNMTIKLDFSPIYWRSKNQDFVTSILGFFNYRCHHVVCKNSNFFMFLLLYGNTALFQKQFWSHIISCTVHARAADGLNNWTDIGANGTLYH